MLKSMRRGFAKGSSGIIAGLDIGTSKVCCAIAKVESVGNLRIRGIGYQGTKGIRGGTIIDMEALQGAIAEAVHQAEEQADETIQDLYVSISPALCQSKLVNVELNVTGHSVDEIDIKKIVQQAATSLKSPNHLIVHTIPLAYELDGTKGVRDPRGMFGETLKARIHLLIANRTPLRNFSACIERSHLEVAGFVTSTYASGLATLVEDELDLGVTLIEMGAGSTSIALFHGGKLAYVDYVPLGGSHVTSDIARCLSTPLAQAERLKTLHGTVMASPPDTRETINVPQIGDMEGKRSIQITKSELTQIIRPRVEEILEQVKARVGAAAANKYAGKRLVLSGGASQLPGLSDMASIMLDKHTRLAKPLYQQGVPDAARTPGFATCAGLLNYGQLQKGPFDATAFKRETPSPSAFQQLSSWLKENL